MEIINKKKHLYNCSLGKDSTAELIIAKQQGVSIDRVVFADLQDADFPQMKIMLEKLQDYINVKIEIIKADYTFHDRFFQPISRGKYVGKCRGFPLTIGGACWVKRDLKILPIEKWRKENDLSSYIRHFGFAKGEEYRLEKQKGAISLLIENNISENEARHICNSVGLLNPLYKHFNRLGCWFCPKQPLKSWRNLYLHFPHLWEKLKFYEGHSGTLKKLTPNYGTKEFEKRFEIERQQITLFDMPQLKEVLMQ